MTNPESRSIELDELALSDNADAVDRDENAIAEDDVRELSAYRFESDDETWVGIGTSEAPSHEARFDGDDRTLVGVGSSRSTRSGAAGSLGSADRTLVGMGPVEREERSPPPFTLEEGVESARVPQSEPPGPFVADDDEGPSGPAMPLPMQKSPPWALMVPAALVAAAGVVMARDLIPHSAAPRSPAAAMGEPPAKVPETTAPVSAAEATATPAAPSAISVSDLAPAPAAPDNGRPASATATPKHSPLAPPAPTKVSEATNAALGSLDIMASPRANVVLDGRPLGKAPRMVKIAPGVHTVVFVHPERGRMLLNVNVNAGQTTSASADF